MRFFLVLILFTTIVAKARGQTTRRAFALSPAIVQAPRLRCAVQLGMEYPLSPRLSLLTELAFLPVPGTVDSGFLHNRYFRIRPELRYQLRSDRQSETYIGAQFGIAFRKWKDLAGGGYFEKNNADTMMSYDHAAVNSKVATITFQFGRKFRLSERLWADFFSGLGLRMVFTSYSEVEGAAAAPVIRAICRIIPAPDPANAYNGSVFRLQTNMGFRLLYSF